MPEPCCSTNCYDREFGERTARSELQSLRRRGPGKASQAIVDALSEGSDGASGRTVLDIGGGVGAVHLGLLERGAVAAVDVDASGPYLEAARSEAERRNIADRVRHLHGDFVGLAPEVEAADLVALDRVVCCYGDVDRLVGLAAALTKRRLALTLPPETVVARTAIALGNAWYRLTRSDYRAYVHAHVRVTAAARAAGLEPAGPARPVGLWRLLVFDRPIGTGDAPVQ